MTEKRFTAHIIWFNYEKTEGEIELKDNGQPLLMSNSVEDVRYIKDLLNELHEENQQLSRDKQFAETELMSYKQRVKDELEMRYCLSNHKPVFEFMAKELDITLEGNVE